jgi:hypothetical protein
VKNAMGDVMALGADDNGSGFIAMLQFGGGSTGDVIAFRFVGDNAPTSGTIKGSIHDVASTGFAVIFTTAMVSKHPLKVIGSDGSNVYSGIQLSPLEMGVPVVNESTAR